MRCSSQEQPGHSAWDTRTVNDQSQCSTQASPETISNKHFSVWLSFLASAHLQYLSHSSHYRQAHTLWKHPLCQQVRSTATRSKPSVQKSFWDICFSPKHPHQQPQSHTTATLSQWTANEGAGKVFVSTHLGSGAPGLGTYSSCCCTPRDPHPKVCASEPRRRGQHKFRVNWTEFQS